MDKIIQGDCLEVLKTLEDSSVDSIVTDPPYELGFMGKSWDNTGIANNKDMWAECLRVLKPGGHLLAFSGTRTYHRMASAIEDAGFEVRDMIEWVYGSGFPKSLNIGKAVKALRETGGSSPKNLRKSRMGEDYVPTGQEDYRKGRMFSSEIENDNTKEEINNEWKGWGTALKPAHEPICMARKPLAEKTVAENVLKYGTGGINIDESRVGTGAKKWSEPKGGIWSESVDNGAKLEDNPLGRFPANLIHDNSEEVRECFPETKTGGVGKGKDSKGKFYGGGFHNPETYNGGDSGNASRYFKSILYYPKASKSERDKGCENFPISRPDTRTSTGMGSFEQKGVLPGRNNHPTVKPIALMEYLIKMITPRGGVVLDPFAGSGSTLVAAKQNGFQYIGIEMTEEYIPIIKARLNSTK